MQKGYIDGLLVESRLNGRTKRLIHLRVNLEKISIVDLCTTDCRKIGTLLCELYLTFDESS